MFWEKVNEILTNYNSNFNSITAYNELDIIAQSATSIVEYIAAKYNQCVLLDNSHNTPRDTFLNSLQELNSAVTSRFWDDSNCSETVFYYIALLNFKAHNYDLALQLLEKSIKQEKIHKNSSTNAILRLHKRCLKAYCLEYLGITLDSKLNDNKLRNAIIFLIGYDVFNENHTEDDINTVIANSIECANNSDNLEKIIKILYNQKANSLFSVLCEFRESNLISDVDFNRYLRETAHILAHCLSEIRKANGSLYKRLHKKNILFYRIADTIMNCLGNEYVTCHSTLKIENGEYFSALSILNKAKEYLSNQFWEHQQLEPNNNIILKELEKQIAQIDFYYWYFSVFARKQDGEANKKDFRTYCDKSSDTVAKTYYDVVNMKEILLNSFELLKYSSFTKSDMDNLNSEYEQFAQNEPHYSIHKSISEEWIFLNKMYHIFTLCQKISIGCQTPSLSSQEMNFYNLYRELFNEYNLPCEFTDKFQKVRENNSDYFHVFRLSCGGCFICKGPFYQIIEAIKHNSIYFSEALPKLTAKLHMILSEQHSTSISNVLIVVDNNYISDLNFIETILEYDDYQECADHHNIYIDTSNLSENVESEFVNKLNNLKNEYNQHPLYCIKNLKTSVMLCAMFTMLERCLLRLSTPIESYVISPVTNDIAFDTQSCDKLIFLDRDCFNQNHAGYFPYDGLNFGSCCSNIAVAGKGSKVLILDKFKVHINCIDYIFYFESNNSSKVINCHAFNVSSHKNKNEQWLFSDVIQILDRPLTILKFRKHENDMLRALDKLYSSIKTHADKCHDNCNYKNTSCSNAFTSTNIVSIEYKTLREYLYSYMGVLLKENIFLLLKRKNNGARKEFVLLALSKAIDQYEEIQLCRNLKDTQEYIRDSCNIDNISVYQPCTIIDLERKIKPCPQNTKYIFISYKSKNGTVELCEPVYKDVVFLQKNYDGQFGIVIDVANFDERFNENIDKYINSNDCIGAFVYLSFDYMCPIVSSANGEIKLTPEANDVCFKEIKLLLERHKKAIANNENFFVEPVYIASTSRLELDSNINTKSYEDLIKTAFDIFRRSDDENRINVYKQLLDVNNVDKSRVAVLNWSENGDHFCQSRNLSINLRRNDVRMEG